MSQTSLHLTILKYFTQLIAPSVELSILGFLNITLSSLTDWHSLVSSAGFFSSQSPKFGVLQLSVLPLLYLCTFLKPLYPVPWLQMPCYWHPDFITNTYSQLFRMKISQSVFLPMEFHFCSNLKSVRIWKVKMILCIKVIWNITPTLQVVFSLFSKMGCIGHLYIWQTTVGHGTHSGFRPRWLDSDLGLTELTIIYLKKKIMPCYSRGWPENSWVLWLIE